MKNLINLTILSTAGIYILSSVSAIAAVNCQPLVKDLKEQEELALGLSYQRSKIEKKLLRIENKIADKESLLSSIQSDIKAQNTQIQQKKNHKNSIMNSIQAVENEKLSLIDSINVLQERISSLLVDIQYLPAGSNARREALRSKKRTEKIIEINLSKVSVLESQMLPALQEIAQVDSSIHLKHLKISDLKLEKQSVNNSIPTMKSLKEQKLSHESQIYGQGSIHQEVAAVLAELNEKVEVCKTFKVKYPLSLKIAKEIYEVGCEQYQSKNYGNKYKNDAETETLSAICSNL